MKGPLSCKYADLHSFEKVEFESLQTPEHPQPCNAGGGKRVAANDLQLIFETAPKMNIYVLRNLREAILGKASVN